jgi:hypothetical protein
MKSWLLSLVAPLTICLLASCGNKTPTGTDGGTDGGANPDDKLCQGAGCIGSTCSKDSDCTEGGGGGICWTTTLLNNPQNVTTPGGYCSRECTADAECGTGRCIGFPSTTKKYCMAKCSSALRCRHPGYSCAFEGDAGGICFPSANFDCNPSVGDGTCEVGAEKYLGGCVRVAYESDSGGVCHLQCLVGKNTCPDNTRSAVRPPPKQLCAYIDSTLDAQGNPTPNGDKFKGNICFDQPATPVGVGMSCKYWTDCQDGYECDRYNVIETNRVCRELCAQMGTPTPPTGTYVPPGAVKATDMCTNTAEGCANSLRAGVMMGASGLCQPRN